LDEECVNTGISDKAVVEDCRKLISSSAMFDGRAGSFNYRHKGVI